MRQNPNAIGYDGLGYVPDDVKMVAVAQERGGPVCAAHRSATVNDKSYPIARDLYMYTAGEPTGAIKDYLDWILSAEAQADRRRAGLCAHPGLQAHRNDHEI